MKNKLFATVTALMLLLNCIPFAVNAADRDDAGHFPVFEIAAAAGIIAPQSPAPAPAPFASAAETTTTKASATTTKSAATTTTKAAATTTTKAAATTTKAPAATTTKSTGSAATTTTVSTTTGTTTTTTPPDHTVKVFGIDGSLVETYVVKHGGSVDLSKINVSKMTVTVDTYTEKGFSQWTPYPEKITEDIEIKALYKQLSLSKSGTPVKTEYYSKSGAIKLDGLEVKISSEEQVPVPQPDGSYKITLQKEVFNITGNCKISPANLTEAFKAGKTSAAVYVYPIIEDQPIGSFEITFFDHLGDVDMNDSCDASDASAILEVYSIISTGGDPKLPKEEKLRYDVDRNDSIDSSDASLVLELYSLRSTEKPDLTWDDFLS